MAKMHEKKHEKKHEMKEKHKEEKHEKHAKVMPKKSGTVALKEKMAK